MKRGEAWWAEYPPYSTQEHLVVLLSWDSHLVYRSLITIAPITTTIRDLDAEVHLDIKDGLLHPCVVNLDAITTIERNLLKRRLCLLPPERIGQIDRAIHLALDMNLPCKVW